MQIELDFPLPDESFASSLELVRARVQPDGHRRTIFFAGKGGVGKTVASCITAVWLARQEHKTLLLTTDPAAHLGDVLDTPVGDEVSAFCWTMVEVCFPS